MTAEGEGRAPNAGGVAPLGFADSQQGLYALIVRNEPFRKPFKSTCFPVDASNRETRVLVTEALST